MNNDQRLSRPRSLLMYVLALAGAVAGGLTAPHLVAAAEGAPHWLLPAVLISSVALGLVAGYAIFRAAAVYSALGQSGALPFTAGLLFAVVGLCKERARQ